MLTAARHDGVAPRVGDVRTSGPCGSGGARPRAPRRSGRRRRIARPTPAPGRDASADSRRPSRSLRARSATPSRCATSSMSTLPLNTNRPLALVHDRLRLDVVLVANLADDLLEQVLDRHEAGGAAVLVDDDRELRLLPLELLQQLGHALALGHHDRRPQHRRDRPRVVGGSSATRSFTKMKPAMLSRLPGYTGNREYSCSRKSARRSPIVASSSNAPRCPAAASSPRAPACRRSRRCSAAACAPRPR